MQGAVARLEKPWIRKLRRRNFSGRPVRPRRIDCQKDREAASAVAGDGELQIAAVDLAVIEGDEDLPTGGSEGGDCRVGIPKLRRREIAPGTAAISRPDRENSFRAPAARSEEGDRLEPAERYHGWLKRRPPVRETEIGRAHV